MRTKTYEEAAAQIRKATAYGASRLSQIVRSAEAADEVGYSNYHFQRLFHAMAGESWADFHRRLRLEQAAGLLWEGGKAADAGIASGFESAEVFIRAFRNAYGCTPSEFRTKGELPPLLPTPNGVHAFDPDSVGRFQTMRRPGEAIAYEVRTVAPMALVGMRHQGPIQFISTAWLKLNDWALSQDIDLNRRLLVTFAEELSEGTPPELQEAFVAMDDQGEEGLDRYTVGGGEFLVARHTGSGHLLIDFWFRLYGECIPESGRMLRAAPPFQIFPDGLFAENPDEFVTDIYLPVEPN